MAEIKPYKTVKECGLKFLSLLVSFKYHVGVIVTIAFFTGLIPWYAWLPALMAVASIRGWEKMLIWKNVQDSSLTQDSETSEE